MFRKRSAPESYSAKGQINSRNPEAESPRSKKSRSALSDESGNLCQGGQAEGKISLNRRSKARPESDPQYFRIGGIAPIEEIRGVEILYRTTPRELNPRNARVLQEVCQRGPRKQSVVRDSAASRSQPIGFTVQLHCPWLRLHSARKLESRISTLSKPASHLDLRPRSVHLMPTPTLTSICDLCGIPAATTAREPY